ncbi:uncharacterized protein A4U43_C10F17880 [Asparagus officinalis]|uniref:DYW domain-containing protein n=1 Tax=Asparagus officinalis TaxID=4686 RepID=A0A5P1E3M7_ASPOF|nr:pentatricopeptide repeat-containing protein At3g16610 [Asparagus officinalis]ONK57224.1 uncharacterized protein A4U43_C10F17880 [Asparagus officinalis]
MFLKSNKFLSLHKPLNFSHNNLFNFLNKPNRIWLLFSTQSVSSVAVKKSIEEQLHLPTSKLDISTYIKLLDSCLKSKSHHQGKKIHEHILKNNTHITNPVLLEKLALLYLSCDETATARHLFDKIPQPKIFLWNAMIRSYSWNGPFDKAIEIYHRMLESGVAPNKFTFPFVLKACSGLLALDEGIGIHNYAKTVGLDSDVFVATALIDMYMKCGVLNDSRVVFDAMEKRDVVAWNAMISGFSLHGLYDDTIIFLLEMQRSGICPNSSTIVGLLPVVGQVKGSKQGKSIHGFCLRRGFDRVDVSVDTALLDMYAKSELLHYACRIFDMMSFKNEVTWSAMIGGYVICDKMVEALAIFDKMINDAPENVGPTALACVIRACARLADVGKGKGIHCYLVKSGFLVDTTIANSLLSMYSKAGSMDYAMQLFNEVEPKDTVTYSAIISGCVHNGNAMEAFNLFKRMQIAKIEPDIATMVGILPACSHLAALQHGKYSHGSVIVRGFASDISVCNSLIDMYAKCGRIDFSREVFNRMLRRDIVSWNAIIAGYGIHGLGKEAISLFKTMEIKGLIPDDITFVCLISACSHSGLITEGKHLYQTMIQAYRIIPRMEHYICFVDLLGRGGLLNEAWDFIQGMPFKPDVRVWGALLGACRVHKNIEIGEEVSRIIQNIGPEGTGNFVLLSNMYSAAGRHDEAARVRIAQREKGFKKSPGSSWIEIGGIVHAFIGGDQSHPRSSSIYKKLKDLLVEIRKLGYRADTSFVLQDVDEEEKENALLFHSEKLAIAFGILSLSCEQPIVVTKNLRVCGDCHTAIKFISLVEKRTITVRDATRFHHFKEGVCNCGDFW